MRGNRTYLSLAVAGALVAILLVWIALGRDPSPHRTAARAPPTPETPARSDSPAAPPAIEQTAPVREPETEPERTPPVPTGGPRLIRGSVRLADGSLPLGVQVVLRGFGPRGDRIERSRVTDAGGEFRFEDLPEALYTLVAGHPGYAPFERLVPLRGERTRHEIEILLTAGGTLVVRTRGPWESPSPGETISLWPARAARRYPPPEAGITNGEGLLRIEHLAPGRYGVQRGRGGEGATRYVTIEEGEIVELVFDAACGLRGALIGPEGQSLAGAIVRLEPVDFGSGGYRQVSARTEAGGEFEVRGVPEGEHWIVVQVTQAPAYVVPLGRLRLTVGKTETRTLRVPATYLSGQITGADTGEGLNGSQLQISATPVRLREGKPVEEPGRDARAWADDRGHYRFVGLEPGCSYRIWIAPLYRPRGHPGYEQARRTVTFPGNGRLEGVDFALDPRR